MGITATVVLCLFNLPFTELLFSENSAEWI